MPISKRPVTTFAKNGSAGLKGDVTISEGANISLTQSGQNIAIAATSSTSYPLDHTFAAAGDDGITFDVTGDTQLRIVVNADGKLEWGSGSATPDTTLYRTGTNMLKSDGGLLATGTFGSDWTEPNLGAGARMMWYPRKAAFRAGNALGSEWNDANVGTYSVALGNGTTASGPYSSAFGNQTIASGDDSTAFGVSTVASGQYSLALGNYSQATSLLATAFGYDTRANGQISTSMGLSTTADSYANLSIGQFNVGGGTGSSWVATDSVLEVGIGADSSHKANALTVIKNGNLGLNTPSQFGSGVGVVGLKDASTAPTTNPSGGGVLYSESGVLKWRRTDGTVDALGSGGATSTILAHSETQVAITDDNWVDAVTYTLPTDLAVGDRIEVYIPWDWLLTAAEQYSYMPRFQLVLGSTTLYDTSPYYFSTNPGNPYRRSGFFRFYVVVKAVGGSPQQLCSSEGIMVGTDNAQIAVNFTYTSDGVAATEDLSAGKDLKFRVKQPIDDAPNYNTHIQSYVITKVKA